ncbi:MAG: signal peptidase I [Lachnospiraceae bacterium]|nr:signal peptidase I [Lachnospiraceae bacterium]
MSGRNWLSTLCHLLGILILACVILSCLPVTIPRYMGYEIYHVVSGSMEPEIPVGSILYVEEVRADEVQAEDVIAFQSGDSVITHRVVKNRLVEGEFVTKGDANAAEDLKTVPYGSLIGRVKYHFPVLGKLMVLYTSAIGKVYVIGFAACGALLNLLAGRIRARNRLAGDEERV